MVDGYIERVEGRRRAVCHRAMPSIASMSERWQRVLGSSALSAAPVLLPAVVFAITIDAAIIGVAVVNIRAAESTYVPQPCGSAKSTDPIRRIHFHFT